MKTPGYKTKTFWIATAAMAMTVLFSTGAAGSELEPNTLGKLLAVAVSLLGAAGYTAKRGLDKAGDPSKPWWKQTEWYLSVAAVVFGVLIASGALGVDSTAAKIVGTIGSVLALMGYGGAQAKSKPPSRPDIITGPLR